LKDLSYSNVIFHAPQKQHCLYYTTLSPKGQYKSVVFSI